MRKLALAGMAALVLAGCSSARLMPLPTPQPAPLPQPGEPLVWGRQDCKRASTSPAIQDHFSRTKAYCEQAAGIQPGDGVNASLVSCMRQRGYNYGSRADHDAACTARTARR